MSSHWCSAQENASARGVDGVHLPGKPKQAESAPGKRAWPPTASGSVPGVLEVCSASPGGCDMGGSPYVIGTCLAWAALCLCSVVR